MKAGLILLLAAFSARAEDGGRHVTFHGRFDTDRIVAPASWNPGESDPIPEEFTAVIFHGRASDQRIVVEGAVKEGADWGPWRPSELEMFPNGRFWGKLPVSGHPGDTVKLRISAQSLPDGAAVQLFEIEAVTPEKPSAEAQSAPAAPAAIPSGPAPKPRVRSRAQWGAEAPESPYEPMIPVRITVHHTEGPRPMTLEDAIQEMKVIQRFHKRGRGWIDIGYHFLIDGSGRVFQGRPETVIGAHVRNKNEGNVGISVMGSFHKPENMKPNKAQLKSLIALARWLSVRYSIDPETIKGHRDQQEGTSCPGDNLWALLPDIRKAVEAPAPPPDAHKPTVKLPVAVQFDSPTRPR